MEEGEISLRFDALTRQLNKVEELARDTHDCVIRLEARVNVMKQPGDCEHCKSHMQRLMQVEDRLDTLRTKFWVAYGGAIALIGVMQVAAHYLLKK